MLQRLAHWGRLPNSIRQKISRMTQRLGAKGGLHTFQNICGWMMMNAYVTNVMMKWHLQSKTRKHHHPKSTMWLFLQVKMLREHIATKARWFLWVLRHIHAPSKRLAPERQDKEKKHPQCTFYMFLPQLALGKAHRDRGRLVDILWPFGYGLPWTPSH